MDPSAIVLVCVMFWLGLWGGLGAYVSSQKGRGENEGLVFGALLGPIGLLILVLMPPPVVGSGQSAVGSERPAYQFKPRRMLGEVREERRA